ncbi:sulfate transporter [Methylophaga nitratireducenticrescens]|nr:sulfate transporter [Methylophaga nitratireducenticrescens]
MNKSPEGFKINAQGHHVPVTKIKPVDLDRDELIDELFKEANDVRHAMVRFKQKAMNDVTAFVELVAEKYDAKLGGKKGNISLVSFDGRRQIRIQIAEHLHFDERVQVAKSLIDDCINEWSADSNDNIKALIEHAFKTNTDGQLNTGRILGLLRLEIDDPKWLEAMEALKDSIQVIGSSAYIRFYERPSPDAKFQNIPLDLSAL